jgi:hypothetical protein
MPEHNNIIVQEYAHWSMQEYSWLKRLDAWAYWEFYHRTKSTTSNIIIMVNQLLKYANHVIGVDLNFWRDSLNSFVNVYNVRTCIAWEFLLYSKEGCSLNSWYLSSHGVQSVKRNSTLCTNTIIELCMYRRDGNLQPKARLWLQTRLVHITCMNIIIAKKVKRYVAIVWMSCHGSKTINLM